MTNFDFGGKILIKSNDLTDKLKTSKGEYNSIANLVLPTQCEFQGTYRYVNCKMRELHIDLKTTTNYLVQCFYATNKKYSCTRTKLGKLLSIVAFIYAQEDVKIFDEPIYRYNGCGTAIKELAAFVDTEIYFLFDYSSDNKEIVDIESNKTFFESNDINYQSIPTHLRNTINRVFKTFGSYSPSELGLCINPIVECISCSETGEVNLSEIKSLTRKSFSSITKNLDVIDFLFTEAGQ